MANCLFITHNEQETKELAQRLATFLLPGDILALEGNLGAGKTTFTQGLAKGLQIDHHIDSPTFMMIKEYQGRLPLYHMDLYRLEEESNILGLDDYFYNDGICVLEWPSRIREIIPADAVFINIERHPDESRHIHISSTNPRSLQLCKELSN